MKTCLIFTFHSPLQLSDHSFFDIGKKKPYFDDKSTYKRFKSNYKSIFKPALTGILDLLSRRDFRCSIYMSGTFLTALHRTDPEIINRLKEFSAQGKVSFLGGTNHESIASIFSKAMFATQVRAHKKLLKNLLDVDPVILSNTENIHFNDLLPIIEDTGYKGLLTEALSWYLHGQSSRQLFKSPKVNLTIFLNDALTMQHTSAEVLTSQIDPLLATYDNWKTHILNIITGSDGLLTVEEAFEKYKPSCTYSVPMPIGRKRGAININSYTENAMQKEVVTKLLMLEKKVTEAGKDHLLYDLSKFTSADYFLDMNYKTITSPEKQPYDFYISMMNMLSDFEISRF